MDWSEFGFFPSAFAVGVFGFLALQQGRKSVCRTFQ